jgi:hypothetical protein
LFAKLHLRLGEFAQGGESAVSAYGCSVSRTGVAPLTLKGMEIALSQVLQSGVGGVDALAHGEHVGLRRTG